MCACRTMLPEMQSAALRSADSDLRAASGRLVGSRLSGMDCRPASFGISSGRIGSRSAAQHGPAACIALWPAKTFASSCAASLTPMLSTGAPVVLHRGHSHRASPWSSIKDRLTRPSQRSLSAMVEAQVVSSFLESPYMPRHNQIHVHFRQVSGVGPWLIAPTHFQRFSHRLSFVFRTCLKSRLCLPLWEAHTSCSLCGEVLDKWVDHAMAL